jgi:hypothetical protein
MDPRRFDDLARSLGDATGVSRRKLVGGLLALAVGLPTGAAPADARRKPRPPDPCTAFGTAKDRRYCRFIRRQCTDDRPFCIAADPLTGTKVATCCGDGGTCCGGHQCCGTDDSPEIACCGDACVATDVDPANCGGACGACLNGHCVANGQHCPPCQQCDASTMGCVAQSDGAVDSRCPAGQTCQGGACSGCASDADCGGACGVCLNGQCVPNGQRCPPCQACDGQTLDCVAQHDGATDGRCPAGQTCQGGMCKPPGGGCPPNGCPDGTICCGDQCC